MNATNSVWGKDQLGIFRDGVVSPSHVEDQCALGILNTRTNEVYVFEYPGTEHLLEIALVMLNGNHGVSADKTTVFANATNEELGTVKEYIRKLQKAEYQKSVIEGLGYQVTTEGRNWHVRDPLDNDQGFALTGHQKIAVMSESADHVINNATLGEA